MNKKIKQWCKENELELKVCGVIATTGLLCAGMGFIGGRSSKKFIDPYLGKSVLSWIPNGSSINLEEAKRVLDLNTTGEGIYALVQEAPNVFSWIVCNDKVVKL